MRYFHYQATDSQGRDLYGTVQAQDADAARLMVSGRGLVVKNVSESVVAGSAAAPQLHNAAPIQQRIAPMPAAAPVQAVTHVRQQSPERIAPSAPSAPNKTKRGSDKAVHFIFSQLASFLRSGTNLHEALKQLAAQQPAADYGRSLEDAAGRVAGGGSLADALDSYPYLYSPDVGATMRAGEQGGFMPEAAQAVSEQHLRSHQLKRRFFYFSFLTFFVACFAPILWAIVNGSLDTIGDQWEHDGSLPATAALAHHTDQRLLGVLPICIAAFVICLVVYRVWNSMALRGMRHRIVFLLPGIGKRAQAESLARVSFVMSLLSKTGVPPQRLMALSAATAPNLAIRDRLMAEASSMRENERLSQAFGRSKVMPEEYTPIISTAEQTGDMPGALNNVARMTEGEYQNADSVVLWKASALFYLVIGIAVMVVAAITLKQFYMGLFDKIQ